MGAEARMIQTPASEAFCKSLGIEVPLICGAMYPCSNPELVAAASEAGAIGIVQPLTLTYVNGYDFREGLRYIRGLTAKPIGLNLLIEASSKIYLQRMEKFLEIALEENVRFFITALGNPDWVVRKVHAKGGRVFHDVTEKKWAAKALQAGVDGLIGVNKIAGGHTGTLSPEELFADLRDFKKPLICAGGVGGPERFRKMIEIGYAGVQMGTRFIATTECRASDEYKQAILKATSEDIVLTERLTGVPVSIIKTPLAEKIGFSAGPFMKWALKNPRLKHWARLYYSLKSFRDLRKSIRSPNPYKDLWQAGKSVDDIDEILPVAEVVRRVRELS
jgi:nitronate monooxygenase